MTFNAGDVGELPGFIVGGSDGGEPLSIGIIMGLIGVAVLLGLGSSVATSWRERIWTGVACIAGGTFLIFGGIIFWSGGFSHAPTWAEEGLKISFVLLIPVILYGWIHLG